MFGTKSRNVNNGISISILIVEILKLLKSRYDYKELSRITGLPVSTLTRYITNKTIPRGNKIQKLITNIVNNVDISYMIREAMGWNGDGIDVSPVISDINIMKLVSLNVINSLKGSRITSIVAIDQEGIPIATSIGMFMERRVYFVSDRMSFNSNNAMNIIYPVAETGEYKVYWFPKNIMNKDESILLVAAVLRSGALVKVLSNKIAEAGGSVDGVFSLIAFKRALAEINTIPLGKRISIMVI